MDLRLVGIVVFPNTLVQDDVDALNAQAALFTPALTREVEQCCATYSGSALQADGGARGLALLTTEVDRATGKALTAAGADEGSGGPALAVATAERSIRPEAIALGVFGGIAGLAALLIALQLIGRQLRSGADELGVLRALGVGPATTVLDGLIGILASVVVGSVLAVVVAVGLSPLAPIGPVRPVYPTPGVAFDWMVLGLGVLVLIVVLAAVLPVLPFLLTLILGTWGSGQRRRRPRSTPALPPIVFRRSVGHPAAS